jgi:hypothetical protein
MPNILQVPVPITNAAVVWPARASSVNSLLFINQDLNNTIWIGQESSITAAGPNTIPIVPNGTFSGDAASPWYVIGSVAGTAPLVVVPNGQAYFLGLTQGQGKLVIPQIQSPDFSLSGQTGWAIFKNGDAYFFNIVAQGTITATAFIGTDFEINDLGAFFYNGTPGPGNLLLSITNAAGSNDGEGNAYQAGVTIYNGTAYIQVHVNATVGAPAIEMPTGVGSEEAHAALYTVASNVGLVNESIGTVLTGPASSYDSVKPAIGLVSSAKNGSTLANGILQLGAVAQAFWNANGFFVAAYDDGNTYSTGKLWKQATSTTINSTTPIPITGLSANVGAGSYYVRGRIIGVAAASGTTQPGTIRFNGTATASAVDIAVESVEMTAGETVNAGLTTALNADPSIVPGAWPLNSNWSIAFEGIVQFSAAGTFNVYGRVETSGSDASWTASGDSWMTLEPV